MDRLTFIAQERPRDWLLLQKTPPEKRLNSTAPLKVFQNISVIDHVAGKKLTIAK
jgi:hypothetical protein